ncbi:MAG: hypothetical protein AAGI08_04630 [Bacteroidota bacterium]
MNRVFESSQHRRVFFAATALLLIVLVSLRIYLSGPPAEGQSDSAHWISLIDNVLSGLFAAILVGIAIFVFRPRRTAEENISHLNANEIVPAFNAVLPESTRWLFAGNRGRYLRSKVVPTLASQAGSSAVEAILIDPCSESACQSFVDYKLSSNKIPERDDAVTLDYVKSQLLATIAVCSCFQRNPHISISLYLSNRFSPIRIDSNMVTTFMTVENKREPALKVLYPYFFHDWIMYHLSVRKSQSRHISLPSVSARIPSDLNINDMYIVCSAVGFDKSNKEIIASALRSAKSNSDPYA